MYDIQSKSDLQSGATLVVSIPEEDLDKKALYTILADSPGFLLPFRQRAIDGKVEFTYQIGNRSKLAYLSRSRSPGEYADLWSGVLQPLLDCGDWFLKPYAFVLKQEYLYCDRDGKEICFLYIPSTRDCSDYQGLKDMITEIAKQNQVADVMLENQVWRALQDFKPNEFLQMLRANRAGGASAGAYQPASPQSAPAAPAYQAPSAPIASAPPSPPPPASAAYQAPSAPAAAAPPPPAPAPAPVSAPPRLSDDMEIRITPGGKAPQEEKAKKGLFGPKKEKEEKPKPEPKEKPQKEQKEKGGLFGRKKEAPAQDQPIIQGAAAAPAYQPAQPAAAPYYPPASDADDGATQLEIRQTGVTGFRYAGSQDHPRTIEVTAAEGGIFTIGRFDPSVGKKQSDFEFDKATKAISRRHAVVERGAGGYSLVDLNSSAGTYVNGQKLTPNAPCLLESGSRVSFGNAGADYVWEG